MTDKTGRKELERKIRNLQAELSGLRSEAALYREGYPHLSALMDNTEDFILICDKKGKPVWFNSAYKNLMKKVLGIKMKPGLQPHTLLPGRKERAWWAGLHKKALRGEKFRVDYALDTGNGDIRYYGIVYTPIVKDGRIGGFTEISRDITERIVAEKKLEEARDEIERWNKDLESRVRSKTEELLKSQDQLVQTEKLSALGRMAGGLAHEMNSPLSGLMLLLEVFRKRSKRGSRDYKELTLMIRSVKYMVKIVRDFSTFTRQSKGERNKLNVNQVIEDMLGFGAVCLRNKGIRVNKKYADRLPPVEAIGSELQQVFMNLLTNSCDALANKGTLTIKTGVCKGNAKIYVEIADNGCGIAKDNLNKIFEPFFTTKKQGEGIGLGLPISYRIIEKHKGSISVKSSEGKGTLFRIVLPAVQGRR